MLENYRTHTAERAAQGIVPLPLTARQVRELCELLLAPPAGEEAVLLELLTQRVPPGVDGAAKVKAEFLTGVAQGKTKCPLLTPERAVELLGTMFGGYNVQPLVQLLEDARLGAGAAEQLKGTLLVAGAFDQVAALAAASPAR